MSESDHGTTHAEAVPPPTSDPIADMHGHIAYLESELAAVLEKLAAMNAGVAALEARVTPAIERHDIAAARTMIEQFGSWEERDEEVGLLKTDVRVLRTLLAECREWLETAERERASRSERAQDPA
jgi:hypothetical protein